MRPRSIVVVGGGSNASQLGGSVLHNLLTSGFRGKLFAVNPRAREIVLRGVDFAPSVAELPLAGKQDAPELAVIAIPAHKCLKEVKALIAVGTKNFVVVAAGFKEEGPDGAMLEAQLKAMVSSAGGCLIGPNCIGLMNSYAACVFTRPIPKLVEQPGAVDMIFDSGSAACFQMEMMQEMGIPLSSLQTVGNGAQNGSEDYLEALDRQHQVGVSANTKVLYVESLKNIEKLICAASSLRAKGCQLAAIKSGSTPAGSRAAASHTGALLTEDVAVDAVLRKAGIARVHSTRDLAAVAAVMCLPKFDRKKGVGIVTHAGGPGVMLCDELDRQGIQVPLLGSVEGIDELKRALPPFSSVTNPIDVLATGNVRHLERAVQFCCSRPEVGGIVMIWGSPGLVRIHDECKLALHLQRNPHLTGGKPFYVVLPSRACVRDEVESFIAAGGIAFRDEVTLGRALGMVCRSGARFPSPQVAQEFIAKYRQWLAASDRPPETKWTKATELKELDAMLLPTVARRAVEIHSTDVEDAVLARSRVPAPLAVLKAMGVRRKTEVNAVELGVKSDVEVREIWNRFQSSLPEFKGLALQPQIRNALPVELFIGAARFQGTGILISFGSGGIALEVQRDVATILAPCSVDEILAELQLLHCHRLMAGYRKQGFLDQRAFANVVIAVSNFMLENQMVQELDLNPLILSRDDGKLYAVDGRIICHN